MARSTEQNETGETSVANGALNDNAIYMSVDGYIGILPLVSVDSLSPAQNAALNEGRKQIALRKAQTVAAKAKKENGDVRAAVNQFLATFEPDSEMEFQTVRGKRLEITREMFAKRLEAMGKSDLAATARKRDGVVLDANKNNLMDAYASKYAAEIEAELQTWATAYEPPTKRNAGGSKEATAGDISLDSL